MRAALLVLAATLVAGCSSVQPLVEVSAFAYHAADAQRRR